MKQMHCLVMVFLLTALVRADDKREKPEFRGFSPAAESLVNKMVERLGECKSYSDEAVIRYETSASYMAMNEMKLSVVYARDKRLKFESMQYDVYADGENVTVYDRNIRRYVVKPIEKAFAKQVRSYISSMMPGMSPAEMLVAEVPAAGIARSIQNLDLAGYEEIDGVRCGRLDGTLDQAMFSFGGSPPKDVPISLWIDMVHHLLRRIEIDQSTDEDDGDDNSSGWKPPTDLKVVLDVKNAHLNDRIDPETFKFDPPSSAKKVDRFYTMNMMGASSGAVQFELSGKKVPEFDLTTHEGARLTDRELLGKVSMLIFVPNYPGVSDMIIPQLKKRAEELADVEVSMYVVWPSEDVSSIEEKLSELPGDVSMLIDPDSDLTNEFPGEFWSKGVILIGKDGVIQGKYPTWLNDQSVDALKDDLGKLAKGESLDSATEMTEEQEQEARLQRSSRYYGEVAEELNAEAIVESWSVTLDSSGMSFSMSTGGSVADDRGFWVRTNKGVSLVGYDGRVGDEIALDVERNRQQFGGWERFVVGNVRGRTGVVLMTSIPGDEEASPGWRPPKGAEFIGFDDSGKRLWEFEVDANNQQVPQHIAFGDLDGRGSDELVFHHQGALWIVDERGEVVAKRVCGGAWLSWMVVDDRDGNGRAEVYLGTNTGVSRYEFRP